MSTAAPYPVVTETVAVPVGGAAMGAYVARPAAPGRRTAVIVGFEMFGVTPYIRRTARRLAALGHVAIVPDFYHRTAPGFAGVADEEGRAAGYALLNRLDRDEVREDLAAVLAHLGRRPDTSGRAGMAGFSLGGHLAYFAATQLPLAAVAVVYPGWLDVAGTALSAPGPLLELTPGIARQGGRVLYLVGADDHVVTADQTRLTARGADGRGGPARGGRLPGHPARFPRGRARHLPARPRRGRVAPDRRVPRGRTGCGARRRWGRRPGRRYGPRRAGRRGPGVGPFRDRARRGHPYGGAPREPRAADLPRLGGNYGPYGWPSRFPRPVPPLGMP